MSSSEQFRAEQAEISRIIAETKKTKKILGELKWLEEDAQSQSPWYQGIVRQVLQFSETELIDQISAVLDDPAFDRYLAVEGTAEFDLMGLGRELKEAHGEAVFNLAELLWSYLHYEFAAKNQQKSKV